MTAEESNLYQPTEAELFIEEPASRTDNPADWVDALPIKRLAAWAVDQVAVFGFLWIVIEAMWWFVPERAFAFQVQYLEDPTALTIFTLYCVSYAVLNGWILLVRGQTIGKWMLKIRIVRTGGQEPDLFRFLIIRTIFNFLICMIPLFGNLYFIFEHTNCLKPERRCFHDYLADTRVVKLQR